jgi:secreted trypsin-like serine protease
VLRLLAVALLACLVLAVPASAQSPRVIGGSDVPDGQLPWTVALVQAGTRGLDGQFCGGTLVNDLSTVVTAAHCVEGATAADIEVLAGVTALSDATEADYHPVDAIAVLPGTTFPNDDLTGDVAVLRLATPAVGGDVIGSLAAAEPAAGTPLRVNGWGDTDPTEGRDYPDRMQQADVGKVSDGDCAAAWGGDFDIATMTCAIGDPLTDSCSGDSGGPLTTIGGDPTDGGAGWSLVGVVSWGSELCDSAGEPGVYARVSAPAIQTFIANAATAISQPEHDGGAPVLAGTPQPGATLTCGAGSVAFSAGATPTVALSVVRVTPGADYPPVVGGTAYTVQASDVGRRFQCRARATLATGGGSAVAYSAPSDTVRAPAIVAVPGPTVQVPGPTIVQTVPVPTPRVSDDRAPRIARVTRRCTTSRRCTFTVRTADASPSAGVTGLSATATSLRSRRCRKNGRRTTCTRLVSRDLRVRRRTGGTFTVTTPKPLPRGTHTLVLVAADANGNVQARPYRTSFRVR